RLDYTRPHAISSFSFLKDTATTAIYTLSLHDALPISLDIDGTLVDHDGRASGDTVAALALVRAAGHEVVPATGRSLVGMAAAARSEEHTSELQSRENLVCRLLLEKKKH